MQARPKNIVIIPSTNNFKCMSFICLAIIVKQLQFLIKFPLIVWLITISANRYELHYQMITFGKVCWITFVLFADLSKAKNELDNILWNLCRSFVQKASQIAMHAQWEESVDTLLVHLQGLHIICSKILHLYCNIFTLKVTTKKESLSCIHHHLEPSTYVQYNKLMR